MMRVFMCLMAAFSLAMLTGCGRRADSMLDPSRVVPFAQPAVFKVMAFGDIEVTGPTGADLKREMILILVNQYKADRQNGVIESRKTVADYCWEKIAVDPDRYLSPDAPDTRVKRDVAYASGSAFAVSREGYLLTNAHVVADSSSPGAPGDALDDPLQLTIGRLIRDIGEKPSTAELANGVVDRLRTWLAFQYSTKAKFKEARVMLNTERDSWNRTIVSSHLASILGQQSADDEDQKVRDMTVRAYVMTPRGEVFPGKDVAVLKVDAPDKLICLPLGDSDNVQMGASVHAMGYPGAAVLERYMKDEAKYRVITHDGEIDQKMPMTGGWEGFHLTAEINHGDSGGPVLDNEGKVIAINVAGNSSAPAQNIVIPINVAKEYLAKAGVKQPDGGPISEHWLRGQQLFARKHYAKALREFQEVDKLQSGLGFPFSETSTYVKAMEDQSRKLGNLKR